MDTKIDSSESVELIVTFKEGPQYHLEDLNILGPSELAQKLQVRWELAQGAVFDYGYLRKFLRENASLLPAEFTEESGVQLITDCNAGTVSVHLHLVNDAKHAAADLSDRTKCGESAATAH